MLEFSSIRGKEKLPALVRAIEEKLLSDNKQSLTIVLSKNRTKDSEESRRVKDLFAGLSEEGFCPICAKEVTDKAAEFLSE
jgi:predicted Ser/Thr protein kinase